jgi:hypothetical protein
MKIKLFTTLAFLFLTFSLSIAQQTYAPFFKADIQSKSISELNDELIMGLEAKNFEVVGKYKPMQSDDMLVICFTRKDLQEASLSFKDRGALASVLKIGLQKSESGVRVSLQNPMYMFYAYFRDDIGDQMEALKRIDSDAKLVLSDIYGPLSSFGGELTAEKLANYHYKVMMPYFDDPIELETYASFEEGLAHIQAKLSASSGVKAVYTQVYKEQKVAVFGLSFEDTEKGEPKYLPIIDESHLSALPYDIILQGKEVTMLPGKYRIALYWPELTMGTFMKIMSTPGDIEEAFKEITEK